jgi:hypothetical protein
VLTVHLLLTVDRHRLDGTNPSKPTHQEFSTTKKELNNIQQIE